MDELVAMENAGWDALCTARGATFYDDLMTDDAVMVFPMGLFDRAASLDAIRESPPWSSFQLESVQVIHPAPEVGVVTYRAIARREGNDPYEAWMSSTYVRDGAGSWRLVLHQQSPG